MFMDAVAGDALVAASDSSSMGHAKDQTGTEMEGGGGGGGIGVVVDGVDAQKAAVACRRLVRPSIDAAAAVTTIRVAEHRMIGKITKRSIEAIQICSPYH